MPFHRNGRKFYHLLACIKMHLYETDGMLFNIDEVKCKKHGIYAAVFKANMTKHDAELEMLDRTSK
jgi:hypothetical protein